MNPEGADLLQTGLREREEAENEPLLDRDNDDSDEDYNGDSKAALMRRMKMVTLTLVIETS